MFKSFTKIAFRNLVKNRLYALINIVGLSVALACCIVAYLNYQFADGFDAFHENADKIYRINSTKMVNNRAQQWGITPMPLGPAIEKDFAGVERAVRIAEERIVLRHEDKVFNEHVYLVDSAFLDMFTYPLKYGSPEALQDKNRLVISAALATKYFGDQNPVGKQVIVRSGNGRTHAFEIGAVAEKEPLNSSIQFNILANYENVPKFTNINDLNNWRAWGEVTFIQVNDPAMVGDLEDQLGPFLKTQNEARPDWPIAQYYFVPLREAATHARDLFADPLNDGMHPAAILAPSITAFLLLLMACFNFMNTSIAFSNKRLKEIGVRKVVGAMRFSLIRQFMAENLLLCAISLLAAMGLAEIFVPAYNSLWPNLELHLNYSENTGLLIFFAVLLGGTAIIAGGYPAYYISKYSPVSIIKGEQKIGGTNPFIRVLITFQFALSMIAIITGVIFTQNAEYQRTFDFGYDKDNLIVVPVDDENTYKAYKNALSQNPQINRLASTRHHVGFGWYRRPVKFESTENDVQIFRVGHNYLETAGLKLLAGRDFDPKLETDFDVSAIVTQKFLDTFGWTEAVGKQVEFDSVRYTIVGVVEDFYTNGFWSPLDASLIWMARPAEMRYLAVNVNKENIIATNEQMRNEWQRLFPDKPYDGFYQDEVFADAKLTNNNIKLIMQYIAGIAILIAAMGLFALVSLNIAKRTKEIGIRKVLGASVVSIGHLINKEFIRLLVVATVIAFAGGYFATDSLISSIYTYHIGIGALPFVLASVLVFIVSSLTVSSQIYKVARANPVEALRSE